MLKKIINDVKEETQNWDNNDWVHFVVSSFILGLIVLLIIVLFIFFFKFMFFLVTGIIFVLFVGCSFVYMLYKIAKYYDDKESDSNDN